MKPILTFLTLLLTFSAFAQEEEIDVKYVDINWKVGSIRVVTQHDTISTYSNDTLMVATGMTSTFKIKVVELRDTVYEVLFKQIAIKDGINAGSNVEGMEEGIGILSGLLVGMEDKLKEFEYSLLVDKRTGQAFKIKNEEAYAAFARDVTFMVFNNLIGELNLPISLQEKNEMLRQCQAKMADQIPLMIQTSINSFNFIFQAYQYPYANGETVEYETQVGGVEATEGEEQLIDTICEVKALETGKELNMDYKYTYNMDQAYDVHVVQEGLANEVSKDQFELGQTTTVRIDLTNGWIKKSTANIYQRLGPIRFYQTSTVTMR